MRGMAVEIALCVGWILQHTRAGGRVHLFLWEAGFDTPRLAPESGGTLFPEVAQSSSDPDRTRVETAAGLR